MYKNVSNPCTTVIMRLNRMFNNRSIPYTALFECTAQPASLQLSPIHQ